MRFNQLKAFHYVAIHQGFSLAAEALSLTQPVISEHVKKLEQDYDMLLFIRERKRIKLTTGGEKLLLLTKQLFEIEEQIDGFLQEGHSSVKGTLRIIVDSAHHLVEVLGQFKNQYPDVFISLHTGNTEEVLAKIRAYNVDIGVVASLSPGNDMQTLTLSNTPIIAFAAKGVIPVSKRSLKFSELAKLPLIFREKGSKTRQKIEAEAKRQGIKLKPVIEADSREAVREIVASGAGIGFVSEAEFGYDDRLIKIPLEGANISTTQTLIHLTQRRDVKIVKAFMDFATRYIDG